ncbi:MAG TPA: tRNA pseudouridine(55) synthase TruB [Gemmatimonadota bacterium]|jgi:tRNA pseudouridine55 synthase
MIAGVLAVDKPTGPTSHDVVDAVRRSLGVRRVGHFGTLDPFASGLLVLGVGPATRLAPFCVAHRKTYRAIVRLGARSDTDDSSGVIRDAPVTVAPGRGAVEAACAAWEGSVLQVPPSVSAKHVDGRRAYALARAGETVTLEAARVDIESIVIERYAWPLIEILVRCGPGTYIRALARDLGEDLGTGGLCESLRRLASGPFAIEDAIDGSNVTDPAVVRAALLPSWRAVADLPAVVLDAGDARAFAQGREIGVSFGHVPGWIRVHGPHGLVGLGEVLGDEDVPRRLRPRRVLFPDGEGRE